MSDEKNPAPSVGLLGRLAIHFKMITKEQLLRCLREQNVGVPPDRLGQILLEGGYISGKGRVAAFEILVGSLAVSNAVREGDTPKIYSIIQSGRGLGMETMDDALRCQVNSGAVELDEVRRKAHDKSKFDLVDEI
ncbi:MAG: hypothetical protein ABIK09_20915 [Pseudomonadota bacterium]